MFAPNVLIAVLGAVGVLALFLGLAIRQGAELRQADLDAGRIRERPAPLERLQQRIDQAGLAITAGEFLRVALLVGVAAGLLFYLLTSLPAGFLLGLIAGTAGYWSYLGERRDRRRQQYQSALGEAVALLKEGFQTGNALPAAVDHVARYGPEMVAGDFQRLSAALQAGVPAEEALRELADRRRDPILDVIVETLVVNHRNQGRISHVLDGLLATVRERVRIRRRIKSEQSQPIWQLRILTAMPFVATIMLRGIAPEYIAFWSDGAGQLSLLAAWGLAIAGYFVGMRLVTRSTAVAESFGITGDPTPSGSRTRPGLADVREPEGVVGGP
jgi:tight adherence protein B